MEPAGRTLQVVVHEHEPPRATLGQALLGPLARIPPRYEVLVSDRTTGARLIRVPVERSRHDADALAAVLRHDLTELDERAFLKRHRRLNRRG